MKYLNKAVTLSLLSIAPFAYSQENTIKKVADKLDETVGITKLHSGFSNTTFNIGLSHERRDGSVGLEGLLMSSGDNGEEDGYGKKDAQLLAGASFIHHLRDDSPADVYLGTGLTVMHHSDVGETDDDKTTFGPLFQIGADYEFVPRWSVGLKYLTALNWSNDDLAGENTYGFVTLGYQY